MRRTAWFYWTGSDDRFTPVPNQITRRKQMQWRWYELLRTTGYGPRQLSSTVSVRALSSHFTLRFTRFGNQSDRHPRSSGPSICRVPSPRRVCAFRHFGPSSSGERYLHALVKSRAQQLSNFRRHAVQPRVADASIEAWRICSNNCLFCLISIMRTQQPQEKVAQAFADHWRSTGHKSSRLLVICNIRYLLRHEQHQIDTKPCSFTYKKRTIKTHIRRPFKSQQRH